jgi:transcriptional regulator with XRE-family HTH domain
MNHDQSLYRLRKRIREYRQVRGMTQMEVAQIAGISRVSYCRIETGSSNRMLRQDELDKIAKVLRFDPARLLREVGYRAITDE